MAAVVREGGEVNREEWVLAMEVTWGWILWYSWLAAFNAQPVSCEEGKNCQVGLLDKDARGSLHARQECLPVPPPAAPRNFTLRVSSA